MDVRIWLDQRRARAAFDLVAVGVCVHAPDATLVFMNHAARELFGWNETKEVSLDELLDRLHVEVVAGRRAVSAEVSISRVLDGVERAEDEIVIHLANGLRRNVHVTATRITDDSGALAGVVATLRDVSETARAIGVARDLTEQSTPVLNVGRKLLLQPLIGTLDSQRAALAMEKLLETIGNTASKVAIVDITGVSGVDTATANHLLRSLAAARLLGCEVVLSGVSPPIARTITLLGLDLSALRTKRDVAAAIEFGRHWVEATEAGNARDATVTAPDAEADGMPAEKSSATSE